MTTQTCSPVDRRGATNERVELGRHTTSADGERVIYGQCILVW